MFKRGDVVILRVTDHIALCRAVDIPRHVVEYMEGKEAELCGANVYIYGHRPPPIHTWDVLVRNWRHPDGLGARWYVPICCFVLKNPEAWFEVVTTQNEGA